MAQQTINVGTAPNDGTGTPLRTAFQYTNSNFTELYTATGPSGNNINVPGAATITGNLTVDTNTLFVDSANNRVGVLTASPINTLHVNGEVTLPINNLQYWNAYYSGGFKSVAAGYAGYTAFATNGDFVVANTDASAAGAGSALTFYNRYRISNAGIHTWETVGGVAGTAMTLNSTGLGVGVTPSAWGSNWKANHVGTVGSFASSGAGSAPPTAMVIGAYNDNTNWKYQFSSTGAARYEMTGANAGSVHAWYTAPGGTVNNNITFTQAMTLAANGQLLLGTSTTDGAIDIGMVLNKPSATGFVGNSYQLNGSSKAYTYITSAAGAFRVDTVTGYTINMVSATNGVYLANGGTSWTALSDERFKDIIEPISNAVAKVGSIRSVIGKFKTESEGTRRSFLIAQDVQAVLPEAVDASNPEKLGVSYTEVIPLLVAAIKELTAEVNALKNA